jgi:uncharacterized protein YcgL (UPF0745 family)
MLLHVNKHEEIMKENHQKLVLQQKTRMLCSRYLSTKKKLKHLYFLLYTSRT